MRGHTTHHILHSLASDFVRCTFLSDAPDADGDVDDEDEDDEEDEDEEEEEEEDDDDEGGGLCGQREREQ